MRHLTIQNLGLIKEVDIELKRVTILIGSEFSDKTLVLKVAYFCDWLECQIALSQDPQKYSTPETIAKHLIGFHKLEGYMQDNTYIRYETDLLTFEYTGKSNQCQIQWAEPADKHNSYRCPKIAYIPAERNLAMILPNGYQVPTDGTTLNEFIKGWESAQQAFPEKEPILDLGISYQYKETEREGKLLMPDGKELNLSNESSGLQALVPMYLLIDYLTGKWYNEPNQKAATQQTPSHTNLYIEEPEAQLNPTTQKALVYWLVTQLNNQRAHGCMLTTQSPYLLTALNNLIQASETIASAPEKANRVAERFTQQQLLPYEEVAAYTINEGRGVSILDPESRLITAEPLDSASQEIEKDFQSLLDA